MNAQCSQLSNTQCCVHVVGRTGTHSIRNMSLIYGHVEVFVQPIDCLLRGDLWDGALINMHLGCIFIVATPRCQVEAVTQVAWCRQLCCGCAFYWFLWKGAMRNIIYNIWDAFSLNTGQSVYSVIIAEELLAVVYLVVQKSVPDSQLV